MKENYAQNWSVYESCFGFIKWYKVILQRTQFARYKYECFNQETQMYEW